MPFIGDTGQLSNIYEKNYETTTLRVVEGDAAYQAYNPADSHYKLITTLQEITDIGNVTSSTVQFSNAITGFTTTSNVGIANSTPTHTLDVGSKAYIDENASNTFWTSGTLYADKVLSETTEITNSVTTRDVLADKFFPKTNGFIEVTSNVGVLNTAPVHTLDIGANVQIDEYGSNTFWTSGNVYSEHYKSSNVTVSGSVDTDQLIVNDINSKDTDFVNFTSNVGVLNTAPVHTLDIGANVQIDEYGSNTFWTSGNVHASNYSGNEITLTGTIVASDFILSGGSQATPTPDLQTISEVLAPGGSAPFSSDRTMTLSNTTTALDATVIHALTVNSNLIGNNVTAVTVNSNLIGNNVTAVTVNSNLVGNNVTAVTVNSNLIGNNVTAVTVNSNLIGNNVTAVTVNSNVIGNNVSASFISGNGDLIFRKYSFGINGISAYTVSGPGFTTAANNPTLTLLRGQVYVFDNSTYYGSHPLQIRTSQGGTAYPDGVVDNGGGKLTFTVPMNAPIKLYYQCTNHSAMGNIIYIPLENLDTSQTLNLSNDLVVGTNKLVVDVSESRVGIGTGTPAYALDVHGTANVGALTATSISGPLSGNADTATALETARTIGGVSFNGTADIDLPGVNTAGTQNTSGNAATATALETARTIGGVSFNGTADIDLPGVNTAGTQNTSGNAATAAALQTARTIGGVSFDGTADIDLPGVNTAGTQNTSGNAATATQVNNSLTPGSYLSGSAYNGGTARTFDVDATDTNTPSKVVARDANGNFSAGTITATTVSGDGSGLTSLNASNVSSGTLDTARIPTLDAGKITTGTLTRPISTTTGTFSGDVVTGNTLYVGTNTGDETAKTIYFGGTYGDNAYDHCVIERRVWSTSTEKQELLLFSGNDGETSAGPDRIRLKGAQILFDTLNNSTDRTTENTKMIIKANGNVGIGTTSPQYRLDVNGVARLNNVAFAAYRSEIHTPNRSYTGTVVFDNEYFDQSGNYDTGTGLFTAPVAGIYHFSFNAYTNSAGSTGSRLFLYKNNAIYTHKGYEIDQHGNCIDATIKLAANDTVSLRGHSSYPVYMYASSGNNIFCGHLLTAV